MYYACSNVYVEIIIKDLNIFISKYYIKLVICPSGDENKYI